MKTLLIACSTFLDKDSYKRHLGSIPYYIDHLTVDGKYKDFDYPSELSDDGTREVAKGHFNVKLVNMPNLTEVQKRQTYLNLFDPTEYKFLLVADSDEFFVGDWMDFIAELEELYEKYYEYNTPYCIGLYVKNPYHNAWDKRPRLWINAHKVLMGNMHFELKTLHAFKEL